ncbi:hypothetical protein SAMN05192529_110111 [Arachidicoccus rhizosphaerae]|uniref:Uncharacterized protein n=1 Tax=Arachidicoccus rhizosphaerae TaxID=551991 RepID=A0A1H3ZAQ4_9BACT|nr:hypothetical protein [Arachidicoccus rhizosphaerae]SEA20474.1 hypothetical protein SAMN05192529_110111 [Arachidicoccus rhizosphaerae]
MKRIFMLLIGAVITSYGFSQDKIILHNGTTIDGKVIKVSEYVIEYTFQNETAEQTLSKYAVEDITYGSSGRKEKVSDKVDISGEEGWRNVVILEDKSQITGLTKVDDIKGKSAFFNMRSANGTDTKATLDLKKKAAKLGCEFVFITADKDSRFGTGLGSNQTTKRAIALKY